LRKWRENWQTEHTLTFSLLKSRRKGNISRTESLAIFCNLFF
jgi:hypothetical protein